MENSKHHIWPDLLIYVINTEADHLTEKSPVMQLSPGAAARARARHRRRYVGRPRSALGP